MTLEEYIEILMGLPEQTRRKTLVTGTLKERREVTSIAVVSAWEPNTEVRIETSTKDTE
jgi:hypothetical protein